MNTKSTFRKIAATSSKVILAVALMLTPLHGSAVQALTAIDSPYTDLSISKVAVYPSTTQPNYFRVVTYFKNVAPTGTMVNWALYLNGNWTPAPFISIKAASSFVAVDVLKTTLCQPGKTALVNSVLDPSGKILESSETNNIVTVTYNCDTNTVGPVYTVKSNPSFPQSTLPAKSLNAKIGSFVITNGNFEDINVKTIKIKINGGLWYGSGISNLMLKDANKTQLGSTITSPEALENTFDISGLSIAKGTSKVIDVYADISMTSGAILYSEITAKGVRAYGLESSTNVLAPESAVKSSTLSIL